MSSTPWLPDEDANPLNGRGLSAKSNGRDDFMPGVVMGLGIMYKTSVKYYESLICNKEIETVKIKFKVDDGKKGWGRLEGLGEER